MRILSVGNMYPPHHLGGYELTWRSAVAALRRAGHEVRVLTSDHREPGADAAGEDPDIRRELRWHWRDHRFPRISPWARLALERHNAAVLDRQLAELSPDVVNWWAMGGMSLSLIERARRAGLPAVGVVGDDWMVYGPKVDAWLRAFAGRPRLAAVAERATRIPTVLDLGAAALWLFNSERTRRAALGAGLDLPRTAVAHPGIDRDLFRPAPAHAWGWRLLYVGRIDRRKGIELAVRALGELPAEATLTVAGAGDDRHLGELRDLARRRGLAGRVAFGRRPREDLPGLYGEADALLFPVQWEEPWGLVPLEAMAVGTPVVATGRGGSGEYLRAGGNCLIFEPGDDPEELAAAVRRLAGDDDLRGRLREGGLRTASRFGETSYNEAIVAALHRAATPEPAPAA